MIANHFCLVLKLLNTSPPVFALFIPKSILNLDCGS